MTRRRVPGVGLAALVAVVGVVAWRLTSVPLAPVVWAHLGTQDVHSLAFEPGSTERLLFGHHEGILESADGGRTWRAISEPEAYPTNSIAATPDGRVVVLGTADALLRSEDGGASWSRIPFPNSPFAVALSGDGRTIALVTQPTDFYRSEDGGRT